MFIENLVSSFQVPGLHIVPGQAVGFCGQQHQFLGVAGQGCGASWEKSGRQAGPSAARQKKLTPQQSVLTKIVFRMAER